MKLLALQALLSCILFSSCITTRYNRTGNYFDSVIGKTKNEILLMQGVPERTMDDGNGGEVIVYEEFTSTTVASFSSASVGRRVTGAAAVYGYGGAVAASDSRYAQVGSGSGISQTQTSKDYCYIYIGKDGRAYNFQTNVGEQYSSSRCYDKSRTWISVGVWGVLFPPTLLASVPISIITLKSAKKNGKLCAK